MRAGRQLETGARGDAIILGHIVTEKQCKPEGAGIKLQAIEVSLGQAFDSRRAATTMISGKGGRNSVTESF